MLSIYPEASLQIKAIKYVATLIRKLDTIKACHDPKQHKRIMKELKRQWDNPLFKSCNNDAEWKNLAKSLLEIREEIYNLYPLYKVSSNQFKEVWISKVNRYLAYCVDGGLLNSHFTLK